ncbi:DUF1269 domain-containing protein [Nostoc sp.]|uniref:DUF1269 domain-containing protein n=1 Tax=Nostoc sp. TaxID=1180 RepID=UPI002FF9F316
MSELVVVSFDGKFKADEVLLNLLKLEQEYLLTLEDAIVVIKDAKGNIKVKPTINLVAPGSLKQEPWGGLFSAVLFHQQLSLSTGVIDDNFVQKIEQAMKFNSSTIFLLVDYGVLNEILAALPKIGGKLIRKNLSKEDENKLRASLSTAV